jgi:acetyltransferase
MNLVRYRRNQQLLLETPPPSTAGAPDVEGARKLVAAALADGRSLLTDPEAKAVLAAYGVPIVESRVAADPEAVEVAAQAAGGPVAVKILSPDISHKSDVGGVALNLRTPEQAGRAAREMLARVRAAKPEARLAGFVVQAMVVRPRAHELIAGLAEDAAFGPVILFGAGGTAVEVIADRAVALPPLNAVLARELVSRTRVSRLLAGYRDRPAADLDAIGDTLVRLARLAIDVPELAELDINPLLADERGVLALDARIRVKRVEGRGRRPAILPYPEHLAHEVRLADGAGVTLRPVRPEDEPLLVDLVARSSAADVRLRFHAALKQLPNEAAARLSQIDYDREMALVAVATSGEALGVARLVEDPERETAEFALLVRSDWQGRRLGHTLLSELAAYARSRGLRRLWGEVLHENAGMLELAANLGFSRRPSSEPDLVRVTLEL